MAEVELLKIGIVVAFALLLLFLLAELRSKGALVVSDFFTAGVQASVTTGGAILGANAVYFGWTGVPLPGQSMEELQALVAVAGFGSFVATIYFAYRQISLKMSKRTPSPSSTENQGD